MIKWLPWEETLADLGATNKPTITVFNKIDQVKPLNEKCWTKWNHLLQLWEN